LQFALLGCCAVLAVNTVDVLLAVYQLTVVSVYKTHSLSCLCNCVLNTVISVCQCLYIACWLYLFVCLHAEKCIKTRFIVIIPSYESMH